MSELLLRRKAMQYAHYHPDQWHVFWRSQRNTYSKYGCCSFDDEQMARGFFDELLVDCVLVKSGRQSEFKPGEGLFA